MFEHRESSSSISTQEDSLRAGRRNMLANVSTRKTRDDVGRIKNSSLIKDGGGGGVSNGRMGARSRISEASGMKALMDTSGHYKRPHVFSPAARSSMIRHPFVSTLSLSSFNELTRSGGQIFVKMSTQSNISLNLNVSAATTQSAREIGQNSFLGGRFERVAVVENNIEVEYAETWFTSEIMIHIDAAANGSSPTLVSVIGPTPIAHRFEYNERWTGFSTPYVENDKNAVPHFKDVTSLPYFDDGTMQIKADPAGPTKEYNAGTQSNPSWAGWGNSVSFNRSVSDGYLILSVKRLWRARTKVTETQGDKEVIGAPPGTKQKFLTLTTDVINTARVSRVF